MSDSPDTSGPGRFSAGTDATVAVSRLRVLLVDDNAERARAVADGLAAQGCVIVGTVPEPADLVRRVREGAVDVVVCDLDSPSRDALESMGALHRDEPRPVVMFVDRSDPDSIGAAMQAGVAAYVIEGLSPARVKSVVDVAVARFAAHQALKAELAAARTALSERKLIERAKGILMSSRSMSEAEAFAALRGLAMDRGRKLAEVADSVVALEAMLRQPAKPTR